jgi:uncharacterized protein YecE (DUF72 family)
MDFGRVPEALLNDIDFSLPAEPVFNAAVLKGKRVMQPSVHLGCTSWGKKEWVGKIYPSKTKEKDFLKLYGDHYNCIELNATHYTIFGEAVIKKWAANVAGKNFKFCPKMYQGVTHRGPLNNKQYISDDFFKSIIAFEEFLGPVFIQVSDAFSPKRIDELFNYLDTLPTDLQFFIEVRHPDWFKDVTVSEAFFSQLKALNIGAVITDTAGRRDCAHMHLTLPKAFIRYVGNSLHPSDYTRCDAWVQRIKYWLDNGLQELYFFIHMHDEATTPDLAVYLVDKMHEATGLNLIKPTFVKAAPQQKGLFD